MLDEKKRKALFEKSPYADTWNLLNRVAPKIKNKYLGRDMFPIGTYKPIYAYDLNEEIPEEEVYFFKLDTVKPNNASSICMIGQCLLPDNWIRLATGEIRKVSDLCNEQKEKKIINQSNNQFIESNICKIIKSHGKRLKYKIETTFGNIIEVTDNHKLYIDILT